MSLFNMRGPTVEATQWFGNGDHPDDHSQLGQDSTGIRMSEGKVVRYFRHPNVPGTKKCDFCGLMMEIHGWIDQGEMGITVCPGDWITDDNGDEKVYGVLHPLVFHEQYVVAR